MLFLKNVVEFAGLAGKLKVTRRSGWISQCGITQPESVADHSFRCAVLAMCLGDLKNVNTQKLIKMMLLHDIQEVVTGDYDHAAKDREGASKIKSKERTAAKNILALLPPKLRIGYLQLWEEFENQSTTEAVLAKDIDIIEMLLQSLEYESEGHDPAKFDTFWTNASDVIKTPLGRRLLRIVEERGRRHRQPV